MPPAPLHLSLSIYEVRDWSIEIVTSTWNGAESLHVGIRFNHQKDVWIFAHVESLQEANHWLSRIEAGQLTLEEIMATPHWGLTCVPEDPALSHLAQSKSVRAIAFTRSWTPPRHWSIVLTGYMSWPEDVDIGLRIDHGEYISLLETCVPYQQALPLLVQVATGQQTLQEIFAKPKGGTGRVPERAHELSGSIVNEPLQQRARVIWSMLSPYIPSEQSPGPSLSESSILSLLQASPLKHPVLGLRKCRLLTAFSLLHAPARRSLDQSSMTQPGAQTQESLNTPQERKPLMPPAPPFLSLSPYEVQEWSIVVIETTTGRRGHVDIGIRLGKEEGVWLFAMAMASSEAQAWLDTITTRGIAPEELMAANFYWQHWTPKSHELHTIPFTQQDECMRTPEESKTPLILPRSSLVPPPPPSALKEGVKKRLSLIRSFQVVTASLKAGTVSVGLRLEELGSNSHLLVYFFMLHATPETAESIVSRVESGKLSLEALAEMDWTAYGVPNECLLSTGEVHMLKHPSWLEQEPPLAEPLTRESVMHEVRTSGFAGGETVSGGPPTILECRAVMSKVLEEEIKTWITEDDRPLIYVKLQGPFFIHRLGARVERVHEVFDVRTGRLLMWGVTC